MEHLYTRKKCTRCTRVARRGGRSVRGAREPVWANSLRIAKDVTRFSSYKEQKRRASETARVLSRVRTKSDPSSEAKTHSEQSRKNTRFATFFSWGSRTGVNARPRPVRRRAVRCLRPRPTPPRGVGPGPTRPPRRLGNARRGRRGAPARASPLGARRPEPHDRYPRARILRAVEARRGARARRPPVRGATVGRSMMDERPRRGSSVRVERRISRSRARRRVRGNRTG